MNQVFDFNRWLLLVGKHWSENRKKYLLSLVAMAGLLLIWFSFMIMIERKWPMRVPEQGVTYFVGLYLAGCIFGSRIFSELSGGPQGIHYICVPASALEKLLTAILYGVVFFYLFYTAVFYLVDYPMIKLANSLAADAWRAENPGEVIQQAGIVDVFNISASEYPHPFSLLLLAYFPIQSAYILGSIYFSRFSYIKTTISILLLFLFIAFFIVELMHGLLPHGSYYETITNYRLQEGYEQGKMVQLPEWTSKTVMILFRYLFAPVLWVVTYFRLKEKEI